MPPTSAPNEGMLAFSTGRRRAWIRRMVFWWIVGMMACAEVLFVGVDKFHIDPDPVFTIIFGLFVFPFTLGTVMTLRARRRGTLEEPGQWPRYALAGLVMFTLWATIYLAVSHLPDPSRVRYLPTTLEDNISLRPAYALLYVLLYPIFALPYFVARDPSVVRRLIVADLLMIVVCSIFFVALPVGVERPPLPGTDDLGTWVLGQVWGNDVSWNCMPSEHCMAAMIAALACWESDKRVGAFAFLATFCIGLSTLFTKQHYLVDVVVGFALAIGLHAALRFSRSIVAEPAGPIGALDRLFNE